MINQDIKLLEYGLIGEQQIAFELKNSHVPMVVLHDIYLEKDDLKAQIDYLVFTRKLCYVIECKNLYGDITITETGDFIRTIDYSGRKRKEGIYSPITQNFRHMELLKQIVIKQKNGKLTKLLAEHYFQDNYKNIVVLANPKTVLHARSAPKDIKGKVIRADQLVTYIKKTDHEVEHFSQSDEDMLVWAQRFLKLHHETQVDYTSKYEQYKLMSNDIIASFQTPQESIEQEVLTEETPLYKELKAYRLSKSYENKIKAYYIYNNLQLKELIRNMPTNKTELLKISGFGEKKVDQYGQDILNIIEKYVN